MIYHVENLSLHPLQVGRVTHKEGHFSVKARPFAAFAYRLHGSASFRVGDIAFTSEAGDITYIPAFISYEADYTEGESLVLHMRACNYQVSENIRPSGSSFLLGLMEEMEAAWQRSEPLLVKSLFFRILHVLSESERQDRDEDILVVLRYLEEHLCDPSLLLTEVARAGFMSVATLRRKFEKHFGISPKEYLIRRRLDRGISLLIGGAAVSEAARACGFRDEKFFSRTVKAHYGVPPSAIRSL